MLTKAAHSAKSSPELGEQRWPADLNVLFQGMQAIGKPDVNVDHHGSGADCPQCGLADRNRVLTQCPIEVLVQQHPVLPKRWLIADHVRHCDLAFHEPAATLDLG